MQRGFLLLLTLFALYACASSVPHTPVNKKPVTVTPAAVKITPPPAVAKIAPPVSVTTAIEPPTMVNAAPLSPTDAEKQTAAAPAAPVFFTELPGTVPPGYGKSLPHIALLLPLTSTAFSSAAEAVQRGFLAAANLEKQALPVRVYGCADESKDVVAMYRLALANGARAVVGPLTRNGVSTLAAEQNIPVPTLTLNSLDEQPSKPLYSFGMAIESEARQVAQLAKKQGVHKAIVVTTNTPLAQRLQFAFEDEWHKLGGKIDRQIEFDKDPAALSNISNKPDTMVFLSTNAEKASLIRPYLPKELPTWATSQIFVGNQDTLINYDLNGIQFVDMPWLLRFDHPAAINYPRSDPPLSTDFERLYALGIDAYRLIQLLLTDNIERSMPLNGVSGIISLRGHIFQRDAAPAVFQQGQAQLTGAAYSAPILNLPFQEVNKP